MTADAPLDESGILARITPALPQGRDVELGPGDDAAVVRLVSPRLVITTDTLTEGHDFLLARTTPEQIGAKAAVQNLADVAAMGARPQAVVSAVSAPRGTDPSVLEGIARGLAQRCARYGASVVGGDLGAADALSITITAVGALPEGQEPSVRSGARPGDVLAVGSDQLGRSAAGLALILKGDPTRLEADEEARALMTWQNSPDPDLTLGWTAAIGEAAPAPGSGEAEGAAPATAMMDLSDGLVRDGGRIARASGVVLDVDPTALEGDVEALLSAAALLGAGSEAAWEWVLHCAEEHAMLATFPGPGVPSGFWAIGSVRARRDGEEPAILLGGRPVAGEGFDHFG